MRLGAISPFGPIFGKELRVTARRKRGYFLRVAYLAGLMLFLLLAYTTTSRFGAANSAVMRAQQQQELGPIFFAFFSIFCIFAMALIGPVLTCTAISSERLHKTFAVLLMTPINAWQIVAGKLFSRLLTALMLIGLSLPVLALVRLLGGVELEQMFGVIVLCSAMALFAASVGLFFSTFMNRAYAVILLSYAAMMFCHLFVPFAVAMTFARNSPSMRWFSVFGAINPFFSTMVLAIPDMRMSRAGNWEICAALHALAAAALVLCSAIIVRRLSQLEGDGPARAVTTTLMSALSAVENDATVERPFTEPSPAPPAARSRETIVGDNPVLWREFRKPLMARRWQRILGSILCVLLLLSTYMLLGWHDLTHADTQIGYAVIFHGLVTLLVCVLSATAIAQEKESDTWTLLLVTPLSSSSIVIGKVLGLLRRLIGPALLIAVHFVLFVGVLGVPTLLLILWVIFSFNALWGATGIYLSLRCRKVTLAVILNLLLPIIAYIAVPLVLLIVGELRRHNRPDISLAEYSIIYIPYYYLGEGIDKFPDGDTPHLPWQNKVVDGDEFLRIAVAVGCVQLALAGIILWRTSAHFNGMVGRAKQRHALFTGEFSIAPRSSPV